MIAHFIREFGGRYFKPIKPNQNMIKKISKNWGKKLKYKIKIKPKKWAIN